MGRCSLWNYTAEAWYRLEVQEAMNEMKTIAVNRIKFQNNSHVVKAAQTQFSHPARAETVCKWQGNALEKLVVDLYLIAFLTSSYTRLFLCKELYNSDSFP